jgi:CRP-like cAMP-binding protein
LQESDTGLSGRRDLILALAAAVADQPDAEDVLDLSHWTASTWQALLDPADIVRLGNGDILIARDQGGADLFFVVKGVLEVSVPQMTSFSIAPGFQVGPGSIVGEVAFLSACDRTASVWSRGPSTLFRLPRAAFDAFRAAKPALSCDLVYAIARIMAARLRTAQSGELTAPGRRRSGLY